MTEPKNKEATTLYALPNLLTYGRIVAVPLLVGCFYMSKPVGPWLALTIFLLAAISDFLDGYLARAWKLHSKLGQMLDPIADKLIVAAALIMLIADYSLSGFSVVPVVLILGREIFVSGLREFLGQKTVVLPVTTLAKWKTATQLIAITMLLAAEPLAPLFGQIGDIGLALLWISAILTLITGYDYFRAGLKTILSEE